MKCIIPSVNLKTFGKAIQSLAKIGTEISIEPTLDGLHLKSVNSTRSCMAFFAFKPRFFQHYDDGSPRPPDQNSTPRFRLTSKCCLNVFKSLNNMDKLVEHCQIGLNDSQSRVVFSLHCKHGIVKNYNLTYMEADPLICSLSKAACANAVKAESKLFTEILASFPNSLEELTMLVKESSMSVRNYIDGEVADPLKSFNTTMTLDREEFETFDVETETSISFCLKEVRAALSFAEYLGYSIGLYFDEAGRPMFISVDCDPSLEMTYIVSTISESVSQSSTASDQSTSTFKGKVPPTPHNNNNNQRVPSKHSSTTSSQTHNRPSTSSTSTSKAVSKKLQHSESAVVQNNASDSVVKVEPRLASLMNDTSIPLLPTNSDSTQPSKANVDVDQLLREIDDTLTTEPPVKKAKSMFFGKKPAAKPTDTQKYLDEILAEDSDDD